MVTILNERKLFHFLQLNYEKKINKILNFLLEDCNPKDWIKKYSISTTKLKKLWQSHERRGAWTFE